MSWRDFDWNTGKPVERWAAYDRGPRIKVRRQQKGTVDGGVMDTPYFVLYDSHRGRTDNRQYTTAGEAQYEADRQNTKHEG